MDTKLEEYLQKFNEADWLKALDSILPAVHEVDRDAVQIWFRFYPLELQRYVSQAEDQETVRRQLNIQGKPLLLDKIDDSHHFLYGHRYWKTVKQLIEQELDAEIDAGSLGDLVLSLAAKAADEVKADASLLVGITAAGLMTFVQTGSDAFKKAAGNVAGPSGVLAGSPESVVRERRKDDSQGLLGFLKTVDKKFSVRYDEAARDGRFPVMNDQQLTQASALDRSKDWKQADPRRWEGPIPVECTAASCGTCWVGVIGGKEKLSEVTPRERRAMKVFGYNQPEESTPFVRLACQAKAYGNVTIVIPPWNGVLGKKLYRNVEDVELEPVTTSAKALRETVRAATASDSDNG